MALIGDGENWTPLRQARADLGWKVSQLIAALRRCAARTNVALGSDKSLKTTVSRHENGHIHPSDEWRYLYRLVYGRTDEELGFADPSDRYDEPTPIDDLRQRLATSSRVDMPLVREMEKQVHQIRLLDRRLGAPSLLEQTRAVMATLDELMSHSVRPSIRSALAAVLADAATLAAWQALDVGALGQAWHHYETAKVAAREAESRVLLAHAMGEQVYALHDLGRLTDAVTLVEGAVTTVKRNGPPLLNCWLRAVEGEVHAKLGDDECHRALERSVELLPADPDDPRLPFISLNEAHLARWRGHCLAHLGQPEAVDYLRRAVDGMDSSFVRAAAGLRCDLAQALFSCGEVDEARVHLRTARSLANQVGSVRQRRRILNLGRVA
ncbi:MAG: amino acid ABC transporter substrate-binding protein [Streptosporangiales bacterium]|nr:amino acid ABC transporter substrate-binding protein [Streptosporangiales bacterium]